MRIACVGLSMGACLLASEMAHARGGSGLSVATTATVSETAVSGVIAITNSSTKPIVVAAIADSLEVRFASGTTPPPLPSGSTSGWYVVVTVAVAPPAPIPAGSTVSVPYRVDTCGGGLRDYRGAKDMRNAALVTAADSALSVGARSLTVSLPAKCAVCGNGIVEVGEQCEGGICCSACRVVADGVVCDDGNACTQLDQCRTGACVGSAPVTCAAGDQCHVSGACNPLTGLCSNPARTDGTWCDDTDACTQVDTCRSGICRGTSPVVCVAPETCLAALCDRRTGACTVLPRIDGTACDDGDACTAQDGCLGGQCLGGDALDCNDHETCTDDQCDATSGCRHADAATCSGCDVTECAVCGELCDGTSTQCVDACWAAFWSCVNACTSTYCAPFCQFDLDVCTASCPDATACRRDCDAGNACTPGCGTAG